MRQQAKDIIGMDDFFEIYINCPIDICEKRDKKGLYEKARLGIINDFTGINSPYEIPINPDLEIKTDILNIEESINKLYDFVLPKIKFNKK
jgi:adenylylsulfate kinase